MKEELIREVKVRRLHTIEELTQVRELEASIWSMEDSVSVNHTIATIKNGGLVLGAYLEEKLIGFQYSFPGFDGEKVYLCSHTLGIHPSYRKYGIGERLKWVQREEARKQGYKLIKWTYDPLETVNGYLNMHKLGAVCSTYLVNAYGEMPDALNAGIPSDRFLVEWRTEHHESPDSSMDKLAIEQSIVTEAPQRIQTVYLEEEGYFAPKEVELKQEEQATSTNLLLLPVPSNFQEIKKNDIQLALEWRLKVREVCLHYFNQQWKVVDLIRHPSDEKLCFYIFRQKTPSSIV
ncbi:GNAT family N-acetyltransferase [Caldalkalibacillus mannanilyticus]|uniref:GNAT family N-acetyltransferase n=1 Tax=Caldalkalibacillus mannanilyticus TaxID=1418 RepID=UPI000684287D|nr:GNAT family N-acetyltransferase [Caldalkalibacillus mannanilyticus]